MRHFPLWGKVELDIKAACLIGNVVDTKAFTMLLTPKSICKTLTSTKKEGGGGKEEKWRMENVSFNAHLLFCPS